MRLRVVVGDRPTGSSAWSLPSTSSTPFAHRGLLPGTTLDEHERSGKATALVPMCIGGGQGFATNLGRTW